LQGEQGLRAPANCRCDDVHRGDWCCVPLRELLGTNYDLLDTNGLGAAFLKNGLPQNCQETNCALNELQSPNDLKK